MRAIRIRLAIALVFGAVVAAAIPLPQASHLPFRLLVGWTIAAVAFAAPLLAYVLPMDAQGTREHVVGEDPGRALTDLVVVVAAIASVAGVVVMLAGGRGQESDTQKTLDALIAVVAIAASWVSIHTTYLVRYARLYYNSPTEPIDFNQEEPPRYSDFAYLAFTLGMAYQVSDTDLKTAQMRSIVVRHSLLSFLFGTVIVAATINLVAGLATGG